MSTTSGSSTTVNVNNVKKGNNLIAFVKQNSEIIKVLFISLSVSFGRNFVSIPTIQLVQDKYCMNNLHLPSKICYNIQRNNEFYEQNIKIYQAATSFVGAQTLIFSLPGVLPSIFLGKWLDKHPTHLKYVFTFPLIGIASVFLLYAYLSVEMASDYNYLVWASIPYGLFGGLTAFFSGLYSFMSKASSPENRAICYGLLEFSVLFGGSPSASLAGFLMNTKPWFFDNLRNYVGVFTIGAFINIVTALFAYFVIDYDRIPQTMDNTGLQNKKDQTENMSDSGSTQSICKPEKQSRHSLREIFAWSNIVNMGKTIARKREGRAHVRLWFLMPCLVIAVFIIIGEMNVTYQFAEAAYQWDFSYYSNVKAITAFFYAGGVLVFPYILQKKFGLPDIDLCLIGCTSLLMASVVRGGFPVPVAFIVSEIIHTFSGLCAPSMRSLVSKIIRPDEISQIFTSLSSLEAISPVAASLLFTWSFNSTIQSYVGLTFHLMALIMFYPFFVLIWIGICGLRDKPQKG